MLMLTAQCLSVCPLLCILQYVLFFVYPECCEYIAAIDRAHFRSWNEADNILESGENDTSTHTRAQQFTDSTKRKKKIIHIFPVKHNLFRWIGGMLEVHRHTADAVVCSCSYTRTQDANILLLDMSARVKKRNKNNFRGKFKVEYKVWWHRYRHRHRRIFAVRPLPA